MANKDKLTPKEQLFITEYLLDPNGTKAALSAGYAKKSAHVAACRLLKKDKIRNAIRDGLQRRFHRNEATADRVIEELRRLAFSDMADFAEWGPKRIAIKDSKGMPAEHTAAVRKITESKTATGYNRSLELHGKTQPMEMLGRHLGLFEPSQEGGDDPERSRSKTLSPNASEIAAALDRE